MKRQGCSAPPSAPTTGISMPTAYAALMAYKAKTRSFGADYLTGEVVKTRTESGRAAGVELADGRTLAVGCVVT